MTVKVDMLMDKVLVNKVLGDKMKRLLSVDMGDADVFVMVLTAVTDIRMAVMTWPDLIACENQDLGHQDPDFYGSRRPAERTSNREVGAEVTCDLTR